jgi:subtilisin family serine protease
MASAQIETSEKLTAGLRNALRTWSKGENRPVVIRTRAKDPLEAEAELALQALQGEALATRGSQLLGQSALLQRFGKGPEYLSNLRESRLEAQAAVKRVAPKGAHSLWLADALVVPVSREEVEDLAGHEDIEAIDLNPTFRLPEALRTPLEDAPLSIDGATWGLAKTRAAEVWGGYGRGADVLVGHLDTGIDASHPALTGRVASFQEFDALGLPVASAPHDSGLHGTHTAGTICGRSFRGVSIGVAPQARLNSALVLPGGGGSFAQIVSGMQWALEQGSQVLNLSLGGFGYSEIWNLPLLNATLAGVLVVASIGNSGHGTSGGPGNDIFALGVGATHPEDQAAGFSAGQTLAVSHVRFGDVVYLKPDLSAPGVQVLSAIPGSELAALSGTSMAAPHVTGAAALLLSSAPGLAGNPLLLRSVLLATVEDYGDAGHDQRFGFGRLDALAAAKAAVALA